MPTEPGVLSAVLSQLEIDTQDRLCIWRIGGETSLDALRAGYARRFEHPDWGPDLMSMSVLTRLGLGAFTPDMAVQFADFVRQSIWTMVAPHRGRPSSAETKWREPFSIIEKRKPPRCLADRNAAFRLRRTHDNGF